MRRSGKPTATEIAVGWQKLTEALLPWQTDGDEPLGRTPSAKHAARSWLILALVIPACAPDPHDPIGLYVKTVTVADVR